MVRKFNSARTGRGGDTGVFFQFSHFQWFPGLQQILCSHKWRRSEIVERKELGFVSLLSTNLETEISVRDLFLFFHLNLKLHGLQITFIYVNSSAVFC